jgi:predicted transcriptional regulator
VPVRLSPEVLARIEKIAGRYGRPKFIRQAVEEKLAREE